MAKPVLVAWVLQLAALAMGYDYSDYKNLIEIFDEMQQVFPQYSQPKFNYPTGLLKAMVEPLKFYTDNSDGDDEHYDFIIVGCGSAGSVLANRLSEVHHWNVLVLEAGSPENLLSRIPITASALQFTSMEWKYKVHYDPGFAKGTVDNQLSLPTGKALGGSSVINYMLYSRGSAHDYERWSKDGNPGWAFEDVLPYFMKAECSKLAIANPHYHNTSGPWSVEPVYQTKLVRTFVEAGEELGYERYADYNDGNQFGFSPVQANVLEGQRHSTARAYVFPARHRENLRVLTKAHVTKILIDHATKAVYGVEYEKDGKFYTAHSEKEVILSAGTINSPQVLMLSGIGPAHELKHLGIDLVADLPVGLHFYDHFTFLGLNFITKVPLSLETAEMLDPFVYKKYFERGDGPLSLPNGGEGIAFVTANSSRDDDDDDDEHSPPNPDIELILQSSSLALDQGIMFRKTMRIRDDVYNKYWGPLSRRPTFTINPILLHPKSKGTIKLRSKSPFVAPTIVGNYLSDKGDVEALIDGIRFAVDLATKTKAFRDYDARLSPIPVPDCEHHHFASDGYWECAIRTLGGSIYHPFGSNKMGAFEDPYSVVDHRLKVFGVKGLRVADCSVIPVTVGAHTGSVAVMIGEKASDMIKEDWKEL